MDKTRDKSFCGLFDRDSVGEAENFFAEGELPNFSISQVQEKSSRHIVPKPVFDETK